MHERNYPTENDVSLAERSRHIFGGALPCPPHAPKKPPDKVKEPPSKQREQEREER